MGSAYCAIDEEAAYRAMEMSGCSRYVPGAATAAYRQHVDLASATARFQKKRAGPEHHRRIVYLLGLYVCKLAENINESYDIEVHAPNDDENRHSIRRIDHNGVSNFVFEYTEAAILKFVNSLGASFTAIKVVPDLGGYRVFREKYSSNGPERYNYGDKFQYDPELIARREAVYQHYKEREESDRKSHNCSLWVVEDDPGALHLVRYFSGTFQTAHNTHWIIRIDTGETLEDWIATATETYLGKYGC